MTHLRVRVSLVQLDELHPDVVVPAGCTEGTAGPAHGGQRRYYLRSGNNQEQVVTLACKITDLGPQQLDIYDRIYRTQHLQEHCEGRGEAGRKTVVLNDYWVDSQNKKVWKSRQWAGPEIGYLRIRDLSN